MFNLFSQYAYVFCFHVFIVAHILQYCLRVCFIVKSQKKIPTDFTDYMTDDTDFPFNP